MPDSLPTQPEARQPHGLADAAAFLAQQWPVFPCGADKRPITEHGFYDAARNPAAVRALFALPGARLIAVPTGPTSDLAVVDLDVKHGGGGLEWLAANQHRLPRTRQHGTRSGGRHLLFAYPKGRTIRNSASKVAPGVDVRGAGGYIIVPPSDGYTITDDTMPAEMPAWLLDLLDPPRVAPAPQPPMPAKPYTGDGTPYGRAALERECSNIRNAADGGKHHAVNKAAYSVAGLVAAGEIPEGAAWSELSAALADIRDRCEDYNAAQRTLRDGWTAGLAAPRAVPERQVTLARAPFGIPDAAPDYDPETGEVAMPAAAQHTPDISSKSDVFPTLSLEEIMALPPPTWLVDKIITEGGFASLYAPPASYKSFVALSMALAVAYGDKWMGRPTKQCGVLYIAGEGARGLGKRIKAWQRKHGREDIDAPFRLLAMSVNLTDPLQSAKVIRTAMALAALEGSPIGLVVIDTVARSMAGADENSAQDMGRFVEACGAICLEVQAAVLGIHHTGKDTERGARGSNALLGGVDAEIKLERFEDRLTVTVTKQKDDEEGDPIQLCVEKVDIGTPLAPATSLVVVTNEAAQALAVGETLTAREERFKALADIAKVLGPNGRMTTARVCAAIGWSVGSRAYARMAEYVPMAPDCVEVTTLEGVARMWRIRETDKPNAALLVRRQDVA